MKKVALITGAASGIGKAFAEELALEGYKLVLVDINRDGLEQVRSTLESQNSIETLPIVADLTDPASPQAIFDQVSHAGWQVDFLINNAGYTSGKEFLDVEWSSHTDTIQILTIAIVELTYLFIQPMVESNYGRVLIVSSCSAFGVSPPGNALYDSSKAFCFKFVESLHFEMADKNIHVTALCPGMTRTNFHESEQLRDIKEKMPGFMWLSPADVARQGIDAVEKGKLICVTGFIYKMILAGLKIFPYRLAVAFTKLRRRVRFGK